MMSSLVWGSLPMPAIAISDEQKLEGYALSAAAYTSVGIGSVVSKILVMEVGSNSAPALWFGSGAILTLVWLLLKRGLHPGRPLLAHLRVYVLVGVLVGIAGLLWFTAMDLVGPNIVSFLSQFQVMFGVLLGFLLLRERLQNMALVGIVLAVLGALLVTHNSEQYLQTSALLVLLSSLCVALANTVVKYHIASLDTMHLLLCRNISAALVAGVSLATRQGGVVCTLHALGLAAAGSTLGMVLFNYWRYSALRYIDLAKVSGFATFTPLVVVCFSYLILRMTPTPLQLVGGVLIIGGITLLTFYKTDQPDHAVVGKEGAP
jgi:drug/metabolite transporter (DMT)-like permease